MKRKVSLLLAIMLVMNMFTAILPASAKDAEFLAANYEFIDTAYSPSLDMYVAVAKDFTKSTNGSVLPVKVYTSTDRVTWKESYNNGSGYITINKNTRQAISWWEDAGIFALHTGENLWFSSDGQSWTASKRDNNNQGMLRGNGMAIAKGEYLLVSGGRAAKFGTKENYNDLTVEHHVFDTADSYTLATGISDPDENGNVIFASAQNNSKMFFYSPDSYDTSKANGDFTNVTSKAFNYQAAPIDMVWEPNSRSWLLITGKDIIYNANADTHELTDFTAASAAEITAIETTADKTFIGTSDGKIYYTDSTAGVSSSSSWTEVQTSGDMNTQEVRSMSNINDDLLLVVTKYSIYYISNNSGEFMYYDIHNSDVYLKTGNERIEVPEEGTQEFEIEYIRRDFLHMEVPGGVISTELDTAPEGVSFDGTMLEVSSNCPGGEVVFNVNTADGNSVSKSITLVDEASIQFEGPQGFVIYEDSDKTYEIKATVIGTDGEPLDREIIYSAQSLPEGITFDEQTRMLTISKDAQGAEVVIRAEYAKDSSIYNDGVFEVAPSYPKQVKIVSGVSEILVPDSGSVQERYVAEVRNQADEVLSNYKVEWSLSEDSDKSVSINSDGILNVPNTAYNGVVKVIATAKNGENILTASVDVTLSVSLLRHTVEDIKELSSIDFTNLKENVTLPTVGSWGSTYTWRSSDENVITSSGVITKDNKNIGEATLYVTATYVVDKETEYKSTGEIKVTVAVNDNVFANPGAESGDLTGFESEGAIEVVAGEDFVHSGMFAVSSPGGDEIKIPVSVPKDTIDKDSSYYIEMYVKASDAESIILKADEIGTLNTVESEDGYIKVTGFFRNTGAEKKMVFVVATDNKSAFYLDDVRGFDVTAQYKEIASAVSAAEYTETQADYDKAKALVDAFYDCPEKDKLLSRLDKIEIDSGSGGGSGGSGGSGGGSGGGGISIGGGVPIVTEPVSQEESEAKVEYANLMFKDMSGHWAKDEVEAMGAAGIVTGRADGIFDPDAQITRAEFSVLITKTMGISEAQYENTFFDVITDDWYSGYVQAARNAGYLSGDDGMFKPNDNITREEIARIVVSAYAAKKNITIETGGALYFNDIYNVSPWAYDYVVNAVNLEFMQGVSEYIFAPKETATRAQAAVILKRLLDKLAE